MQQLIEDKMKGILYSAPKLPRLVPDYNAVKLTENEGRQSTD